MADAVRAITEYTAGLRGTKVYYNPVALDSDDSTTLMSVATYTDKTIHVYGTFGTGGSLTIQGSNKPNEDGTTMVTLHKTDLSAMTFTAAGCFTLLENPLWLRAIVTAGDGTTALTVALTVATSR